jgi:hypothetical protein
MCRQVFPAVTQIIFSNKTSADVRVACGKLLKVMQGHYPSAGLWTLLREDPKQDELKRLLNV